MKIHVFPEAVMSYYGIRITGPHIVISITEPGREARIEPHSKCRGIHRVQFHDTDKIREGLTHITPNIAKGILAFVLENKDSISEIVVHCSAGISRSAGCAGALALILNGDDSEIFDNNAFMPNRFVYRAILNQWNKLTEAGATEVED